MSGFPILDLVLGIIFVYFLLSIISSSVVEIIMTVTRTRARVLSDWLLRIFDTKVSDASGKTVRLGKEIMDHCALTALSDPGKAPSYIDANNFVTALFDKVILYSAVQHPTKIDDIIAAIESTTALSKELKQTFLLHAREAKETFDSLSVKTIGAMEMFRRRMENWYDTNMDRVTGTMKANYTRWFTMATAIGITLVLNADTIAISKFLYRDDEARARVAARAYETSTNERIRADMSRISQMLAADATATATPDSVKIHSFNDLQMSIQNKLDTINQIRALLNESIPLGWSQTEFANIKGWGWLSFLLLKLAGLAVTALAIMMGAPFWFDVLNKVANIRGTGPKPASSTDSNFNKPGR